jgi:hypothetical protein
MEHRLLLLRFEVEALRGMKWEGAEGEAEVKKAAPKEEGRNGERDDEDGEGIHL